MSVTRGRLLVAGLALVLSGCGGPQVQVAGTGGSQVTGTASYDATTPAPAGAELELWITDISPMPVVQAIIAQGTVPVAGPDTAFALRYDDDRIAEDHTYSIRAALKSDGRVLYATEADTLVLTRGHSHRATLVLRPIIEEPPASAAPSTSVASPVGLSGTSWRLESLAGTPAVSGVEATLEFLEGDRAAGNASCNRFTGAVKVDGTSITFGPLVSTRMACVADAVSAQERAYLDALNGAERFTLDGTTLEIFSKGQTSPLRFQKR